MQLRFSRQSLADLDELKDWLTARSPQGQASVSAALSRNIRLLLDHPGAGRSTSILDTRNPGTDRTALRLHHPYTQRDGIIWILRVYSARRYPLNLADLKIPDQS